MATIEHKGMEVETLSFPGEPMTRDYPGADAYVEIESVIVSDWDEFTEWWGAKGECPMFAPSLDELLERISNREHDAISDIAWEQESKEEPDFDCDDDSYWDDHDPYAGGAYDY
tara:strand:+ start:1126 stop:1467 length:342 start_codon:yes stop_codon:yes gene_type:complete